MTNHRNKQNYRFRTWKFRDRCRLKGGVRQGCFLSLILNYLIQYIHFHSLYIISHYYAKFKENPCVGTDASTPFSTFKYPLQEGKRELVDFALSSCCLMIVVWFFLMMPRVCLQFVILVFPDHTQYFCLRNKY